MVEYTKQLLEDVCKDCYSYAEVLRRCGRKPVGGNYEILKNKIKQFNIDISHFTGKLWSKNKKHKDDPRIPVSKLKDDDIFCKNNNKTRKVVRDYILRHNKIEYKCQMCGNDGHWLGYNIALDLDHIDGDNTNNEFENLRFLCPNCHATTNTYRGKNKRR